MSTLKQADFYYGAFLSYLLNFGGKKPSLFDESPTRRIYKLATDTTQKDYVIYTKYANARQMKSSRGYDHWVFRFTDEEIKKLNSLKNDGIVKVALICAKETLKDGEIALVDYDVAMKCLGDESFPDRRINIKALNGKHGLRMYGSGRSDKINGKDNMIVVPRDAIKEL